MPRQVTARLTGCPSFEEVTEAMQQHDPDARFEPTSMPGEIADMYPSTGMLQCTWQDNEEVGIYLCAEDGCMVATSNTHVVHWREMLSSLLERFGGELVEPDGQTVAFAPPAESLRRMN